MSLPLLIHPGAELDELFQDDRHAGDNPGHVKYHIIWVTKHRYKVLRGEIAVRTRELLRLICGPDRRLQFEVAGLEPARGRSSNEVGSTRSRIGAEIVGEDKAAEAAVAR